MRVLLAIDDPLTSIDGTVSGALWAAVAALATWIAARYASRTVRRVGARAGIQDDLSSRAARLARYL